MSSLNLKNLGTIANPLETQTNASAYYKINYRYSSMQHLDRSPSGKRSSMNGVKRVLAFCCLTAVLPALFIICPLYLKHQVFKDIVYSVAESDILEVRDGISTIFCQEHALKMNSSFNAFQLRGMPDQSKSRKHIRLKKSMVLPDDTLEYWGFYLMKGATVALKVCSRYDGSRILVVKGDRNLRTCGLMEHNKNKFGAAFNSETKQVRVTFETAAEIVDSNDITLKEQSVRYVPSIFAEDEAELNHGGEDLSDFEQETQKKRKEFSANYLKVDKNTIPFKNVPADAHSNEKPDNAIINEESRDEHETDDMDVQNSHALNIDNEEMSTTHRTRHHKEHDKRSQLSDSENQLNAENTRRRRSHNDQYKKKQHENVHHPRARRDTILDRGINHGGNAQNYMQTNESESISSFENALLECYDGQILVAKSFNPSKNCISVQFLEQGQGTHMVSTHEVNSDGYYYYIFYSDNDQDSNNIHAIFDIYKPTYLYSNISQTKGCINSTECHFPIQMFSDEVVIVEVPTRDGIEHEDDDITLLISTCVPRMAVYVIFPIAVLLFILGCAFI